MLCDYVAVGVVRISKYMVQETAWGRGGGKGTTPHVISRAANFISYILVQNIFHHFV